MLVKTPSYMERDFTRTINSICYRYCPDGIPGIIARFINTNRYNQHDFSRQADHLYYNSKRTREMKFSSLLGLTPIDTNYQEEVFLDSGVYHWNLSFRRPYQGLENTTVELEHKLNNILIYLFCVIKKITLLTEGVIKFRMEHYKSLNVKLFTHQVKYSSTPWNWLHRFSSNYCGQGFQNVILPIYDQIHGPIDSYLTETRFPCLYPGEILDTPLLDVNMSILELFHHYGHRKVDETTANNIWSQWKSYVLWKRKSFAMIPLTLVYQNRANIISLYNSDDEMVYYSELGEILLGMSKLDLALQQIICCYL